MVAVTLATLAALVVLPCAGATEASDPARPDGAEPPPLPIDGLRPEEREAIDAVRRHDARVGTRIVTLARARVSVPQEVSGGLTWLRARVPEDYECGTVCDFRGPLVGVEAGLGGIQLAAGYGIVVGEHGPDRDRFVPHVHVGMALKGAVLRTWNTAWGTPPDRTFVGAEASFTVSRTNFSLALFRQVRSSDPDARWMVSGGLGWGF